MDSHGVYSTIYEQMADEELLSVAADKKSLVEEAQSALDLELAKRNLIAQEPRFALDQQHSGDIERRWPGRLESFYRLLLIEDFGPSIRGWRVREVAFVGVILFAVLWVAVWFGPDSIPLQIPATPYQRSQFKVLIAILADLIAGAALIVIIAKTRKIGEPLSSVGWNAESLSTVACIFIGIALAAIVTLLLALLSVPSSRFIDGFAPISLALYLLTSVLLGPFLEEFYFRGLLFIALVKRVGEFVAVGICALLFGLIHIGNYRLLWMFVLLGVVMGIIRVRTRSVAACYACHAAYNVGILLAAFAHLG